MARPKKTTRTTFINVGLPQDLAHKVELHLYSGLEGKVPHGKKSEFFTQLVEEFFRKQAAVMLADGDKDADTQL
jgi:hypothetical protein